MKKTEQSIEGSNDVSEHVEMAGWGVEEADRANKMDASSYSLSILTLTPRLKLQWNDDD
jgi:hypothetical protein